MGREDDYTIEPGADLSEGVLTDAIFRGATMPDGPEHE